MTQFQKHLVPTAPIIEMPLTVFSERQGKLAGSKLSLADIKLQ